MEDLPDTHDGFFDGLWISENKSAYLFLQTPTGQRLTIVLNGVERMKVSNFMAGNIILDVVVVESDKVTIELIEQVYELQPAETELAHQLLSKAQQRGLSVLEINPSYGAECVALFRSAEIHSDHVLPQMPASAT